VRVSEIGDQTPHRLYGWFFAGSFMKIAGSLSFWNLTGTQGSLCLHSSLEKLEATVL
jgi:hypothetical protein